MQNKPFFFFIDIFPNCRKHHCQSCFWAELELCSSTESDCHQTLDFFSCFSAACRHHHCRHHHQHRWHQHGDHHHHCRHHHHRWHQHWDQSEGLSCRFVYWLSAAVGVPPVKDTSVPGTPTYMFTSLMTRRSEVCFEIFWGFKTFTTLLSPSYRIFKSLFLRECISAFILCLVPLSYSGAFILTFCTSWRCLAAQIPIFTANTLNLVLAAPIKAHLHIWTFCARQSPF